MKRLWGLSFVLLLGVVLDAPKTCFCDEKPAYVDCYMQDAYAGDALKNIQPGEVRRLRIVAIDLAESQKDRDKEGQKDKSGTPISLGGTDKPLRVLGEVPVEKDGSAWFEIPSDRPVFFQLIDQRGWAIQTMRQPISLPGSGEVSCLGCHSPNGCKLDDRESKGKRDPKRLALSRNTKPNKPKSLVDPSKRFRYVTWVQPIWDRHCVSCHTGDYVENGPSEPVASLLSGPLRYRPTKEMFSESYLTLVDRNEMPLIDWIAPNSQPAIKRPYSFGSIRSELMIHLEPSHYEIQLSDEEKRIIECWIDIGVPF